MKNIILAFAIFFLGSMTTQAQNPTPSSGANQPGKSWVLKLYPHATDISWHKEKTGTIEFEFNNGQTETKVWFNAAGEVVKTKVETEDDDRQKTSPRRKKDDDDHSQKDLK